MLFPLNYEGHSKVPTRQQFWTNRINGIPRLSKLEKIFVTVTEANAKQRSPSIRSEQKSFCGMQSLVDKFSKPSELVVILLSGTLATAKA